MIIAENLIILPPPALPTPPPLTRFIVADALGCNLVVRCRGDVDDTLLAEPTVIVFLKWLESRVLLCIMD